MENLINVPKESFCQPPNLKKSPSHAASRHQLHLQLISANLRGQKQRGSEIKMRNPEKMISADLTAGRGCLSPGTPAGRSDLSLKVRKVPCSSWDVNL